MTKPFNIWKISKTNLRFLKCPITLSISLDKTSKIIHYTQSKFWKIWSIWTILWLMSRWERTLSLSTVTQWETSKIRTPQIKMTMLTKKLTKNWSMPISIALKECSPPFSLRMKKLKSWKFCQNSTTFGIPLTRQSVMPLRNIKVTWKTTTEKRSTSYCIARKSWEMYKVLKSE